jgi:hypothetical protein
MTDPHPFTRRRLIGGLSASLAAPVLASITACGGGDAPAEPSPQPRFTAEGLSGRIVRRLRPSPLGLLAATDAGAFRRAAAGQWMPLNLGQFPVLDIAAVSVDRSFAVSQLPDGRTQLLESQDAGANWVARNNDFGGVQGPERMVALFFDAPAQRLYATGANVLARSLDGGGHWERLAGQWHAVAYDKEALAVDPTRGDVWYGGQDAIEDLALFRWRAGGGQLDAYPRLMASPSTVKGIRFAMGEPDRVIVAGEGGLVHTRNNGVQWQPLLHAGYRFHFDVLQDPNRPQRLVTASWEKNFDTPQPLRVDLSDDDGLTWWRIEHPDHQLFGGVWSMAIVIEGGRSVFLLGLYRGGVMRLELE